MLEDRPLRPFDLNPGWPSAQGFDYWRMWSQARHQKLALKDQFFRQVRVQFHEELLLRDDLSSPLFVIDRLCLLELFRRIFGQAI